MAKDKESKDKELQVMDNAALAVPDYLKATDKSDQIEIASDEVSKTYLKICQYQSRAFTSKALPARIIYTSNELKDLTDNINIIILDKKFSWIKFDEDLNLIASSSSGQFWEYGTDYVNKKITDEDWSKCKRTELYVFIEGDNNPIPYVISVKTTKKSIQNLNALFAIYKGNNEKIYARVFNYSLVDETSKKGAYFDGIFNPVRFITKKEHDRCLEAKELLKTAQFVETDPEAMADGLETNTNSEFVNLE